MRRAAWIVEAVVALSLAGVIVRSMLTPEDGNELSASGAVIVAVLAVPSILGVALSRRWPRIFVVEGALALAAWLPLGAGGDLSCVDCGFAVLLPLAIALPQLGLLALGYVLDAIRRRGQQSDWRT